MTKKLNKSELLHELVSTLLRGWTKPEVIEAIENLGNAHSADTVSLSIKSPSKSEEPRAKQMIEELDLVKSRKAVLIKLASEFDDGNILSSAGDIKRFLEQRNITTKGISGRNQAFRRMIPIFLKMSEKGIQKFLTQARFTGPAELSDISEAIKSAGSDIRG